MALIYIVYIIIYILIYRLHVSGKFSTELGLNKSFVYLVHPKAGLQLSKTTTL